MRTAADIRADLDAAQKAMHPLYEEWEQAQTRERIERAPQLIGKCFSAMVRAYSFGGNDELALPKVDRGSGLSTSMEEWPVWLRVVSYDKTRAPQETGVEGVWLTCVAIQKAPDGRILVTPNHLVHVDSLGPDRACPRWAEVSQAAFHGAASSIIAGAINELRLS